MITEPTESQEKLKYKIPAVVSAWLKSFFVKAEKKEDKARFAKVVIKKEVKISDIKMDRSGNITVSFNQKMKVPFDDKRNLLSIEDMDINYLMSIEMIDDPE